VLQTKGLVKNVSVFGRFLRYKIRQNLAEFCKNRAKASKNVPKSDRKSGFSDPVFENLVKSAPACQAVLGEGQ